MTTTYLGNRKVGIGGQGDGFGYGFGIVTAAEHEVASAGTFSWGGIFNTYFWADPNKDLIGVLMTQVYPFDHLTVREDFRRLSYEAIANLSPAAPAATVRI